MPMAKSAEYGLGQFAFPRGWFAVAQSAEIGRAPFNVHYFGQDMVLYRGASGRVVMLDAYCPHMGTHFGSGPNSSTTISASFMEEDNIRCPFHAWRFGADGVCNNIPYHDGPIPPLARVKSWPVEERYGIIFCWNDPEGQAPDFDVIDLPEWNDVQWLRWEGLDYLCDLNHPIEIFDNMSDVAHLDHLHGGHVTGYENELDGHLMHQRQTGRIEGGPSDIFKATLTTIAGYVGPGTAFGKFIEMNAIQLICVTPVEDGESRLWQAVMMKAPVGLDEAQARVMRQKMSDSFGGGLLRDGEVWKAKKPALKVMQLPSDGPIGQSRVWYSQFYNPRAEAAAIVRRVAGKHYSKAWPPFDKMAAE
jgi:3-ketosteroid 9alpha-monooxygenase subunit A